MMSDDSVFESLYRGCSGYLDRDVALRIYRALGEAVLGVVCDAIDTAYSQGYDDGYEEGYSDCEIDGENTEW